MNYEYLAFFILGLFTGAVPMSWFAYRSGWMDSIADEELQLEDRITA